MTSRSLVLEWDPPVLRHRNGIIQDYRVVLTLLDIPSTSFLSFIVSENTIGLTSLHPHYTYSCTVSASTSAGQGPDSLPFSIKTFQDG